MISDQKVRQIVVESLDFGSANSECKRVIGLLKAREAPIGKCIRNTVDTRSHICDDTWIEVIFKNFKENQNVECFNLW